MMVKIFKTLSLLTLVFGLALYIFAATSPQAYADIITPKPGEPCPADHVSDAVPGPEPVSYVCVDKAPISGGAGAAGGGAGPAVGKITSPLSLDLGGLAANLLTLAFFGAGLFFLIQMVIGGFAWMGAGGDPKAMEAARSRITNAVIGVIIVAGAFGITVIVTSILGINIFSGTINIP